MNLNQSTGNSIFSFWDHPIYEEKLDPSIIEFADKNRDWLKDKAVSLFCTCLDKNGGLDQLRSLEELMDIQALTMKAIGGRLILEKLDEADHDKIKEFLKLVKLPFGGYGLLQSRRSGKLFYEA